MGIQEKLLVVQGKLKAPKNQRNDFGKYNFRSYADILEAVKPLLQEVKATIVLSDTLELIGDRYYVKATATFYDCESAEAISNTSYAREEEVKKGMDGSQITGASSSYARKYALNGLLVVDDTDDSDATNHREPITKAQISKIMELNVNIGNVLKRYGVNSLEELTYNDAAFVISTKEKALAKVGE